MPVVQGLNGSFERQRDEQTNRDCQQMEGEIFPATNRLVRRLNIHY